MKEIKPNVLHKSLRDYIHDNFGEHVLNHCKAAELRISSNPLETELVLTLIVLERKDNA